MDGNSINEENHHDSLDFASENIEQALDSPLEESDNDGMRPEEILQEVENAWLNEKFAPELLPHKTEVVESLLEQIYGMEENLQKLKADDIRLSIHRMELMRIKFIVTSYLRERLNKIENFAVHLLKEDETRSADEAYMTPNEAQFAREYLRNMISLFKSVALNHMRHNELNLEDMSLKPNLKAHVFLKANTDIPGVKIDENEIVSMTAGSQHIVQYEAIADLLKKGDVQLM